MPYPYITQAELEARVSPAVVRRILDDATIGIADADAVTRIIADASAKVAGFLRESYSLDAVSASTPEEVKRLTLDVAVVYLRQRHPEFARGDWVELDRSVTRDLNSLRTGNTRLDVVGPPEPHQSVGRARVTSNPLSGWSDDDGTSGGGSCSF